jgi:hypothetical protein
MLKSPTGEPIRWREVEPFVWRKVHGTDLVVAEAKDGRIQRFSVGDYASIMMFERPPLSKSGTWLLPAAIAALVILLVTALAWPISALVRRYYRVPSTLSVSDAKAQRRMRIVAVATVLVWAGWMGLVYVMMSNISMLSPKMDGYLRALQVSGAIVFVGGTLVGLWSAWTTLRGERGLLARAWTGLLVAALLVSLWVAIAFNVLRFSVHY